MSVMMMQYDDELMIQSVNEEVDGNKNENINANDKWCGFNIYSKSFIVFVVRGIEFVFLLF